MLSQRLRLILLRFSKKLQTTKFRQSRRNLHLATSTQTRLKAWFEGTLLAAVEFNESIPQCCILVVGRGKFWVAHQLDVLDTIDLVSQARLVLLKELLPVFGQNRGPAACQNVHLLQACFFGLLLRC